MASIVCPSDSEDLVHYGECRQENTGRTIGDLKLIVPVINQHPLSIRGVRIPRLFNMLPDNGDLRYMFGINNI
jgi:hypothetical protein